MTVDLHHDDAARYLAWKVERLRTISFGNVIKVNQRNSECRPNHLAVLDKLVDDADDFIAWDGKSHAFNGR